MYWQEENNEQSYTVPEDVVDALFSIRCSTLPVDHAWALAEAIREILPWFPDEPRSGLHIIHGADSGNGWERPQGAGDLLYLSRRTRLELRLPQARVEDAATLSGRRLIIHGHEMEIGRHKTRRLAMTNILYSRYLVSEPEWSEDDFIEHTVTALRDLRLRFKKVLSGKTFQLATPEGPVQTRSLMVADLPYKDAVILQQQGIGPRRNMGCGLFIPQKSF